jgi:DNA polymerase-3 subunit delta'
VILDAADDLEREAFNALLKSLEEPPPGTIFLLVAHRPGRLPATIRSRCRTLRFAELDDAEVGRVLDEALPELAKDTREAAILAAGGSPGAALDFARRGLGETYKLMLRLIAEGDADFARRGALLAAIGQRPDREQQVAAIEAARMALVAAATDAPPGRQARIVEAHSELVRLLVQAPTANFDPAALVLEIGGLLASVAADREAA